jgi:5-methylcytosine-specific restriction endonuclease McrA
MAVDRRAYLAEYRSARKQRYLEYLGGKCVECGSTDDLEFDHVDPQTRSFCVGFNSKSEDQVFQELTKCQLLCHTCHLVKSATEKAKGSDVWTARLTEDQVLVIRELYQTECKSYSKLAEEFDVTSATIRNIVKRITWTHI